MLALISLAVAATCAAEQKPLDLTAHHFTHPGRLSSTRFAGKPEWQRRAAQLGAAAEAQLVYGRKASASVATILPSEFGADPTGDRDSSEAFDLAIRKLLACGGGRRNGANQTDLGGATLNLAGGVYAVSRPVSIPAHYANYRIEDGSIIAHRDFDTGEQYLLTLGGVCGSATAGLSKNCATDISVSEVTIDGRDRAWGGVQFVSAVNVNVGPQVMVIGFQGVGINLQGCGAGYIHESWAGQYEAGDPHPRKDANATVVLFDGGQHDSDVLNVIIFSGKIGVNSSNGANRLQGVHTWNLVGSMGGTGILLHSGAGRVQDAYLDYAPLVIRAPTNVQVTGCLFLGSSTIVLATAKKWPCPECPVITDVRNLVITSNKWNTNNKPNTTIILDESEGRFSSITDTVIEDNEIGVHHTAGHGPKKGSRATLVGVFSPGSDSVLLNFSSALLFSPAVGIAEVRCTPNGPLVSAFSSTIIDGHTVQVQLERPAPPEGSGPSVSVLCDVDQSQRSCAAH